MPRGPGAVFVMVQSEIRFVFLETAFDRPARAAHPHQLVHRDRLRSVAQRKFDCAVGIVAQQQPAFTLRGSFRAQINPDAREGCHQRSFLALGYFVSLPVPQPFDLKQLRYRTAFLLQLRLGPARFGPDFSGAGDLRQVVKVFGQLFQKRLVIAKGTIADRNRLPSPAAAWPCTLWARLFGCRRSPPGSKSLWAVVPETPRYCQRNNRR